MYIDLTLCGDAFDYDANDACKNQKANYKQLMLNNNNLKIE